MEAPLGTAARNRPEVGGIGRSQRASPIHPPKGLIVSSLSPGAGGCVEGFVLLPAGEQAGRGDPRERSGCGIELGGKGRWSWGSSQVNPFNGPVLPLAVCRSTSTVGLPLESRISRAKIFCMAMAARREV